LFANNDSVISSEDLDGWIDQFTEDAIFMRPEVETVKGKEAGRESVRSWFEQLDMEASISVDEIEVLGDWAFARWSFEFRYTPKSGGETTQRNGKEIWILKRQPDGSWKCSHIIYNYDSPPPSPNEE
jgi:ketosteroid isomerase-like protein